MTSVNISGGAYTHPSLPANAQRCVNQFPSSPGPEGRGPMTLLPTMGTDLLVDLGSPLRGLKAVGEYIYAVSGSSFYKITINTLSGEATAVAVGTLLTSDGIVTFASNPYQIIIMDGSFGYIYNYEFTGSVPLGIIGGTAGDTYSLTINSIAVYSGAVATQLAPATLVAAINAVTASTHVTATLAGGVLTLKGDSTITGILVVESGTGFLAGTDGITVSPGVFSNGTLVYAQFSRIIDTAFVGGTHVVYIDSYFIYNQLETPKFYFSQQNEGRMYNAIDVASAESKPDKIIALGQTKGELWVFGTESIEVWYDAANPQGSPFSKRVGSDIDVGCRAAYSVVPVNNVLIWLDSRGFLVQSDTSAFFREQSSGYKLKKCSTEAFDAEIARYTRTEDAIGTTYTDDRGHMMYELTFPTDRKTWVFDASTEILHEKSYVETTGEFQGHSYSLTQFVSPFQNSNVGGGLRDGKIYKMSSEYLDDNGQEIHRIRTTAPFQNDFKLIGVNTVEVKIDTGNAPQNGQGSDPKIMMRYSNDSGHTWSNELWRSIGKVGQYNKRVIWNIRGTAYEWLMEFKITDPVKYAIIDATANIDIEEQV